MKIVFMYPIIDCSSGADNIERNNEIKKDQKSDYKKEVTNI